MGHDVRKLANSVGGFLMGRLSTRTRVPGNICVFLVLAATSVCFTKNSGAPGLWERETLTNGYGGLADQGIEVSTSVTQIYQEVLDNGTLDQSTGLYSGSYDPDLSGSNKPTH